MGLPLICNYSYPQHSGVLLTTLGVDNGKQEVMSNLGIFDANVAGYMHFPLDDEFLGKRGYDQIYFKGLISEHKVTRKSGGMLYQVWEPIDTTTRNEPLDLAVYNLACAQSCVGKNPAAFWQRRREILRDKPAIRIQQQQSAPAERPKVHFKEQDVWTD